MVFHSFETARCGRLSFQCPVLHPFSHCPVSSASTTPGPASPCRRSLPLAAPRSKLKISPMATMILYILACASLSVYRTRSYLLSSWRKRDAPTLHHFPRGPLKHGAIALQPPPHSARMTPPTQTTGWMIQTTPDSPRNLDWVAEMAHATETQAQGLDPDSSQHVTIERKTESKSEKFSKTKNQTCPFGCARHARLKAKKSWFGMPISGTRIKKP